MKALLNLKIKRNQILKISMSYVSIGKIIVIVMVIFLGHFCPRGKGA